jgi:hypothetical protein
MQFVDCVNMYYNGFSGNQDQHSFFVDNMIPTMVDILTNIRDLLVTSDQGYQLMYPSNGAAFLWEPMGSPPAISDNQILWNWTDYLTHLCYGGLDLSTSYPTIYPPNSDINFVRAEYISAGNTILKPK